MKTTALALCLCLSGLYTFAQSESKPASKWTYGFNLGLNYSNVLIDPQLLSHDVISNGVGFRVGLLAAYELNEVISISPKAELSFNNGSVDVAQNDGSTTPYKVMPVNMDFITHFVFKKPGEACSPYLLIGPKLAVPLSKKSIDTSTFGTSYDVAIDLGIGLEKAFTFFRLAPELRYSYGLLNVNQNPVFQDVKFHNVALVLNFVD